MAPVSLGSRHVQRRQVMTGETMEDDVAETCFMAFSYR